MRPEDAADEGARAREPALKRPRMMEGAASKSARGSVSALEKREWGGLKARGAGGKEKRPLDVTLTAGGEPTDVGRREEEPIKGCNRRDVSRRGGGAPERGWCRGGASQACEKSP